MILLIYMKKKSNTRFNLTIVLSRKLLRWSLLAQLPFYATFAPTLPLLYASAKAQMQVKRPLNGRCASVQRAPEHPPVVRRTALSNTRIKLTAKLRKPCGFLASCSLSAARQMDCSHIGSPLFSERWNSITQKKIFLAVAKVQRHDISNCEILC